MSLIRDAAHKFSWIWHLTVHFGASEVEAWVFFLESLQQDILLHFILEKWVYLLVTFTGTSPCFSFLHFVKLDMQFIIFNHPETF